MNANDFFNKMLDFNHYEYIAIPLFIFIFSVVSLQRSGFIKSTDTVTTPQKSFRLKMVDLGLIITLLIGSALMAFKKNPGMIDGKYLAIFSVILLFVRSIYYRFFEKEIKIINQQHEFEQEQQLLKNKNRKRNIIIYVVSILVFMIIFIFASDGIFSNSAATVLLIFGAVIAYVVGFVIVWNKR
jgi:hypothetical protein